jgi:hypothetical protein
VEEVQSRPPVTKDEAVIQTPSSEGLTDGDGQRSFGDDGASPSKTNDPQDTQGMSRREILAEKRRQILEARMALLSSEPKESKTVHSEESDPIQRGFPAYSGSNDDEERKREREREAQRLAERTRLARDNRLAMEAQNSEQEKVAENEKDDKAPTAAGEEAVPVPKGEPRVFQNPTVARTGPSLILQPMVREANRLSGFIRRYENKLDTVCRSMLTMVSEDTGSEDAALAAKELPLPEMLEYVSKQEWYKNYSLSASSPSNSMGPPTFLFSRSESKRAVMEEMNSEKGSESSDASYSVTAVGKAFLHMDGPVQADMSRFLAHIETSSAGMNRNTLKENWKEIARISGDAQSQRICDKLDDMISFALDAHMIK